MKIRAFILILSTFFLSSCGAGKVTFSFKKKKNFGTVIAEATPKKLSNVNQTKHIQKLQKNNTKLNKYTLLYIQKYAPIAVHEMHTSKIPASITLAQGILESGNGRSNLASKSNNHFGIKCHTGWTGQRVYHDDDAKGECFRKYQYVATSFRDHSDFLSKRRRYAFLFAYNKKNYKKWAKGLKKAGYATDPKYPQKLITIIKNYKLYEFDSYQKNQLKIPKREVKTTKKIPTTVVKKEPKPTTPIIKISVNPKKDSIQITVKPPKKKTPKYYTIIKGDTLYSISKKFKTTVTQLKLLNTLVGNELNIGQRILVGN